MQIYINTHQSPGSPCDPKAVDCAQCDWCEDRVSSYYRCVQVRPENPFKPVTGYWSRENCTHGYLVDPTKPLTGQTAGGQCVAWDDLHADTKKAYLSQERCNLPPKLCIYGQDEDDECTKNYWFQEDPWVSRVDQSCQGAGDVFHLESENCGPCGDACTGKGSC